MHVAACCQKEKESKAALHFILRLKRKTLHCWESYVARLQTKKKSQGHYKLPVTYLFNVNHKLSHTLALVHILKLQFLFFFLALAQRVCRLRLMRMFWSKWSSALHHKRREEDRLQAAGYLAVQSTQRRALEHWRACILNIKQTLSIFIPIAAS